MNDRAATAPGFAGIVLAGGRSQRMGRDKAELRYRGRTLLAHMVARLQACGARRLLISGPPRTGYTTIPDQQPDMGPLGGIHAAFSGLMEIPEISRLLIVPVDMPALRVPTLTALLRDDRDVRACHYAGHPLPLCLTLDSHVLLHLNRLLGDPGLAHSQRSLHTVCADLNARVLPLPRESADEFLALNTPGDWATFRAGRARTHAP